MGLIEKETFVCVDCETTGLNLEKDRIIEVAVVVFTFDGILDSFETLIDPGSGISKESQAIHHITDEMVKGKPKIHNVLEKVFFLMQDYIVVGHGILFDINMLHEEALRSNIKSSLSKSRFFDTLRMARLYGESPINSLEKLREHFNIDDEGAHRAMSDVLVNIEVFKQLAKNFKTTEALSERLKKPIPLKMMPLGKHKGRKFGEIPVEYLQWAASKDFDEDLIYSIRLELSNRRKGKNFHQASNPFAQL